MISDLELTELLTAKFCHDLSGPVGALNNGVEFLNEASEEMRNRAIALVDESAKEAVTRLQFFRQAYGAVHMVGEVNISQLRQLALNFFSVGKVTLNWTHEFTESSGVSMTPHTGKLLLNMLLFNASTLIHGGNLTVELYNHPNKRHIAIAGEGKNIKVVDELVDMVLNKGNSIDVTTRNVQVYLTSRLASLVQAQLSIEHSENKILFIAEQSIT